MTCARCSHSLALHTDHSCRGHHYSGGPAADIRQWCACIGYQPRKATT